MSQYKSHQKPFCNKGLLEDTAVNQEIVHVEHPIVERAYDLLIRDGKSFEEAIDALIPMCKRLGGSVERTKNEVKLYLNDTVTEVFLNREDGYFGEDEGFEHEWSYHHAGLS